MNNISLEKINNSNKKDLFELVSNYNVMKYVGKRNVWSSEKTNKFINYCTKEVNTQNKNTLYFKIIYKKTKKFIGIIGIHKYSNKDKDYTLTVFIKKSEHGKGIGSHALKLILDIFHKKLPHVKHIIGYTLPNNIATQKSLNKNGFIHDGKIKMSGKYYLKYVYYFKYHNLIQDYPYYNYFVSNKKILNNFLELKTLKFNQLNKKLGEDMIINIEYEKDMKYNRITNYYTDECRMKCIFKNNMSPLDYYNKNKGIIIKNSLLNNNFNYDKFENYMYKKSNFCNNFQISIIMNIFNYFKPTNILDSSAGWGDRLIASIAYSQINNLDVSYTGVDPSKCLKPLYNKIIKELGNNNKNYNIINKPFEKITKKDIDGGFDLAFTSPPFWDLEVYENNKNQSIMGFKNKNNWVKGFLNKLADLNIENLIKGGYFVVYIPPYEDFMNYMNNRKDIIFEGNIYFKTSSSSKRRQIMVWKKK